MNLSNLVGAIAGGLGALLAIWLTATTRRRTLTGTMRFHDRPRLAALTYAALCAVSVYMAHDRGPATWLGLFFAVLVPCNAWWAFRAGVEAWVDWSEGRKRKGVGAT